MGNAIDPSYRKKKKKLQSFLFIYLGRGSEGESKAFKKNPGEIIKITLGSSPKLKTS